MLFQQEKVGLPLAAAAAAVDTPRAPADLARMLGSFLTNARKRRLSRPASVRPVGGAAPSAPVSPPRRPPPPPLNLPPAVPPPPAALAALAKQLGCVVVLLSQLSRDAGVDYRLLSGRIDRIKNLPYSQLVLSLSGDNADRAIAQLRAANVHVELLDTP